MNKIKCNSVVAGTAALFLSIPLYATQTSPTFIHMLTEHLPPYQIVDEHNAISGFAVDIIEEAMDKTPYSYNLQSYSWSRTYNLAQRKENHCVFSIARLKSRENLFKWVGKISSVSNTFMWALKSRNLKINHIEDAKRYTIAVNRNDIDHTELLERGFDEDKHLYVLDSNRSIIKLLATRPSIDLIIADESTIGYRAELVNVPLDSLERVYKFNDLPLDFYLACSNKTDDKIIATLADSLYTIHADGSYERILNKWKDTLVSLAE